MTATGGGIPIITEISDSDQKFFDIITPTAVMGDDRILQPNVSFDFSVSMKKICML